MTHQQLKEKMIAEFVEEGAALEHARWAKWQTYLHSRCVENLDGSLTIPAELVSRWQRQIATTYEELSETEKESDRKQVRDYIPLLSHAMDEAATATENAGKLKKDTHEYAQHDLANHLQTVLNAAIDKQNQKLNYHFDRVQQTN